MVGERRFYLREETSAAHRALDDTLGQVRAPEDYVRYLRAMTAFRLSVEAELEVDGLFDGRFQSTRLRNSLENDCVDLGLEGIKPVSFALKITPEAVFGMTYVLEGSTLGAPFLFEAANKLGFDSKHGARHLDQQIRARGNWGRFTALLEEVPALDMARVSEAARATFNLAQIAAQEALNV